ncbi:2S sulfur-rich seed storage protein 1-like [Quercus suber]|uniref:2S sulfur-rich seed storage protein 1-like n=1 Tax=Quercus suber TaxID=58331 RepID=UPI0032DE7695
MAKLSAVAALLAALLLIGNATAYRRESGESCSEQLQQQQFLNHCQMHLRQQCSNVSNTSDESKQFQLCCRQLKQMDRGCRCDGLNMMMRELMREEQGQQQIQEMMQMAQNLPNQCNMKPRRCEMEMLSFRS